MFTRLYISILSDSMRLYSWIASYQNIFNIYIELKTAYCTVLARTECICLFVYLSTLLLLRYNIHNKDRIFSAWRGTVEYCSIRRRIMYDSLWMRSIHEYLLWHFVHADLALLFSFACNFSDVLQFYSK